MHIQLFLQIKAGNGVVLVERPIPQDWTIQKTMNLCYELLEANIRVSIDVKLLNAEGMVVI